MNFIITILGSGAALPIGGRHCSAQMVNINGEKILIDCAESTQDGIRRNHIRLQSISIIAISHLHGDHFFGLPGLLSTMHLCGRNIPLNIIAPCGAKQVIDDLFRITGNHVEYPIIWHELDFTDGLQTIIQTDRSLIQAFPLQHSVPTFGFRITEVPRGKGPARTYTYCCDTAYSELLLPYIADSDLLCTECTFANDLSELATTRQHLTANQAATLALNANAGHLLLTHISARYRETDILSNQASTIFQPTTVAHDNMIIEVKNRAVAIHTKA